jgi:sterol desaturase/sphingolipid hydroxylase (fatty acid hydroxylase superfamily)
MYRRYGERRHRRHHEDRPRHGLTSFFRSPGAQIAVLLIVAFIIYLILQSAGR